MVQFVPFREFNDFGAAAQHALAKHVLAEIPGQFIAYMEANGIPPLRRRPAGSVLPVAADRGGVSAIAGGQNDAYFDVHPPMPPQTMGMAGVENADDTPPPYTL